MRATWLLAVTVLFLFAFGAAEVQAHSSYVSDIPNGAKFSCNTCHVDINVDNKRNQFGLDFKDNNHTWNATLADKDSDSDGASNGTELQDPNGTWRPGQPNPGNVASVTNPGDPASKPPTTFSLSGAVNIEGTGEPLANLTMLLSGGVNTLTTTTNASGNYTFTGLVNGTYTISPTGALVELFTFTPPSAQRTINNASVNGVDFIATPIGTTCSTWNDVIAKYNQYVAGDNTWNDVIECYNQYVGAHP